MADHSYSVLQIQRNFLPNGIIQYPLQGEYSYKAPTHVFSMFLLR